MGAGEKTLSATVETEPGPLRGSRQTDGLPVCDHCGLTCRDDTITLGGKCFCCNGCRKVYELLHASEMCAYYDLAEQPGITPPDDVSSLKYGYLDDEQIRGELLEFSDGTIARVTFTIPSMHCASCIWLLEQLGKLDSGVLNSRVDFLRKELSVTFREAELSLRGLVELLASLGYEPRIRLEDIRKKGRVENRRRLYMQIGVAGFAFGNIMLLSFPEYLARGGAMSHPELRQFFPWLNLLLVLPVVFFSGFDYLNMAWRGLRRGIVNLDVPISLGILALFGSSVYEVLTGVGPGYFDSLAGLVFLLLLGKLFQAKTYETLSFERDYTSYFPIAVIRREEGEERSVPVVSLKPGDRIMIRNQELIPADSVLIEGEGRIDYSFVTGESEAVAKESGDVIYAGGRQLGEAVEIEVIEEVSRSYLTRLWNHDSFSDSAGPASADLANRISKYFVAVVLLVAVVSFFWYAPRDISLALRVFTSVLIVACPCALALASPFTLGTAMRIFGRHGFYLKNAEVVERLAKVSGIVFDKTGTLTHAGKADVAWHGEDLSDEEKILVKSLIRHSTHPVSIRLNAFLKKVSAVPVDEFREIPGKGVEGIIAGRSVKLGSLEFVTHEGTAAPTETGVTGGAFLSLDGKIRGSFILKTGLRDGVEGLIGRLRQRLPLFLLSGDSSREKAAFARIFPAGTEMRFEQSPVEKLNYIERLRNLGLRPLMLGDGLNDAGALKASDVGVALTDDVTAFSPASDALLDSDSLSKLDKFIYFSRSAVVIISIGFVLSFMYNLVGLGFAVMGKLSPLVSAILMPLSSITVVVFATSAVKLRAYTLGLGK